MSWLTRIWCKVISLSWNLPWHFCHFCLWACLGAAVHCGYPLNSYHIVTIIFTSTCVICLSKNCSFSYPENLFIFYCDNHIYWYFLNLPFQKLFLFLLWEFVYIYLFTLNEVIDQFQERGKIDRYFAFSRMNNEKDQTIWSLPLATHLHLTSSLPHTQPQNTVR